LRPSSHRPHNGWLANSPARCLTGRNSDPWVITENGCSSSSLDRLFSFSRSMFQLCRAASADAWNWTNRLWTVQGGKWVSSRMALTRGDGLFSDSSCRAIGLSGGALAGDREPCRGCEAVLWLVTANLAGKGGDDSDLGRRVSTNFAFHWRFDLPRTFDTSSSISVGTPLAESVWAFLYFSFGHCPVSFGVTHPVLAPVGQGPKGRYCAFLCR
jgi:hypothetical protein